MTVLKPTKKKILYKIEAYLELAPEDSAADEISSILDNLRSYGTAEVTDISISEKD